MNCPKHRSKLEYLDDLSAPHIGLTSYYCSTCETIYSFKPMKLRTVHALWKGVTIFKRKLRRLGYEAPTFTG